MIIFHIFLFLREASGLRYAKSKLLACSGRDQTAFQGTVLIIFGQKWVNFDPFGKWEKMGYFSIFIPGKAIFSGSGTKNGGNCLRVGSGGVEFPGFVVWRQLGNLGRQKDGSRPNFRKKTDGGQIWSEKWGSFSGKRAIFRDQGSRTLDPRIGRRKMAKNGPFLQVPNL